MKLDLAKLPVLEMVIGFLMLSLVITFVGAFIATEGESGGEEAPPASATPADGETPPPSDGAIAVDMKDNSFDPDTLTVAAGTDVTFDVTNSGRGTHNMRIAGADGEYDNDDDAVSDPDVIRGGDAGTLEWTAPTDPGDIDFRCDFHPDQMTGTIAVQ